MSYTTAGQYITNEFANDFPAAYYPQSFTIPISGSGPNIGDTICLVGQWLSNNEYGNNAGDPTQDDLFEIDIPGFTLYGISNAVDYGIHTWSNLGAWLGVWAGVDPTATVTYEQPPGNPWNYEDPPWHIQPNFLWAAYSSNERLGFYTANDSQTASPVSPFYALGPGSGVFALDGGPIPGRQVMIVGNGSDAGFGNPSGLTTTPPGGWTVRQELDVSGYADDLGGGSQAAQVVLADFVQTTPFTNYSWTTAVSTINGGYQIGGIIYCPLTTGIPPLRMFQRSDGLTGGGPRNQQTGSTSSSVQNSIRNQGCGNVHLRRRSLVKGAR